MFIFARLGRALRLLRDDVGRSQKQVAAGAGVTPPMLSSYERERARPEVETLDKILHGGLGLTLADLAWALDVVNDRLPPGARRPASGAAGPSVPLARPVPEPLDASVRSLLGGQGEALPPALEEGYDQVVRGLLQISRFVFERVAQERSLGAAAPGATASDRRGRRR